MSVLLNVYELGYTLPHRTLFEGLSFSIEDGETIALIGKNGAGKSTLIRIMAGLMEPDHGKVTRSRGLNIQFLEQTPSFPEGKTVREVIVGTLAEEMISRLNLREFLDRKAQDLSGGWQKKVAIAQKLALDPDLLLLDEPTNHLDIYSILWLEGWIKQRQQATLMVSHDRDFLRNTCRRVIEIDPRFPNGILSVQGNLDQFLETKQTFLEAQAAREVSLKNTLRREIEWLHRGAKARTTKQKARIDRAEDLRSEVQTLAQKNQDPQVRFGFEPTEKRNPKKMIELKDVTFGYPGLPPLLKNLNLTLHQKTRLGLLGNNGSGKTTLIRIINGELKPEQGTVFRADRIDLSFFDQNRLQLDPDLTVLRTVCPSGETVEVGDVRFHVRSYLDRFLFSGSRVDLRVKDLSGGEQARLLLALLMMRPANLLILDEPTNDLDFDTLNLLEEVIEEFPGAVILVSHDRAFMNAVCNQILAFPEMVTYSEISQWERARKKKTPEPSRGSSLSNAPPASAPPVRKKKLSFKEQFEYDRMEETIAEKDARMTELKSVIEQVGSKSNTADLIQATSELATIESEIEQLYVRWAELESKSN